MRDGLGRYGRVLLLGGTSEIGRAVLDALPLAPDADVMLAGRDVAVTRPGARSLAYDARDPSGHDDLVAAATAGGDLDLVIAATGVLDDQGAPSARARAVLETNLTGLVSVLAPLAEGMRAQRHGTLVVLSSVAAVRPRRANYLYGASKAGLDAWTRGLADELHGSGVRVLLVRPGFVHGRMTAGLTPAPFSTTPEVVGARVARALRTGRDLTYAPAPLRLLTPVLSLLPRPLWRRLPG